MKTLQTSAWILFAIGLILKVMHYPVSIVVVIAVTLIFIHSFIYFTKHFKTEILTSFANLTFAFWSIYLLFRIQYWQFSMYIFTISILISWIYLILNIIDHAKLKFIHALLIVYFMISLTITLLPTYKLFYFLHSKNTFTDKPIEMEYFDWDKYSWFLYNAKKHDEALEANKNAEMALLKKDKFIEDDIVTSTEVIKKHRQQIIDHNWNKYP